MTSSSSNNRVSDTTANSEEPEKSPAEPSQLSASSSEVLIYDLAEQILGFQLSIYGTPRSDPVSIPDTSSSVSSCDTGAAYLTPPEERSTSTPPEERSSSTLHADSSSELSTRRAQTINLNRMVHKLMNEGYGYIAACIKVGRIVRLDKIREDDNDVPHQRGEKSDFAPQPPGSDHE